MAKKRSTKKKSDQPISMKEARDFNAGKIPNREGIYKTLGSIKRDNCATAKKVYDKPNEAWLERPDLSDVKGIDEPHKRVKPYKRAKKGKKGGKKSVQVKGHYVTPKPGTPCAAKPSK